MSTLSPVLAAALEWFPHNGRLLHTPRASRPLLLTGKDAVVFPARFKSPKGKGPHSLTHRDWSKSSGSVYSATDLGNLANKKGRPV